LLNLVRKGKISRSKAAELSGINFRDPPKLLARYEIPWFHYSKGELGEDLKTMREREGGERVTVCNAIVLIAFARIKRLNFFRCAFK